jgi:hypothetical protein
MIIKSRIAKWLRTKRREWDALMKAAWIEADHRIAAKRGITYFQYRSELMRSIVVPPPRKRG